MQNDTGETVTCGGSKTASIVGGVVGYNIQRSDDDKCVNQFIEKGYKVTKITD